MVRFAWSWTLSDTFTLREDAPQNRLWNGSAVVEVTEFVFRAFCLMLTICSVTYYGLFCMILDSFGYLHTLLRCSTKLAMKWLACCGGKGICISCFFALCSLSRTDKSRHTHTEMRHDTLDRERHTCPMFNILMANIGHLFRNVCWLLSTWYHTISINSGHNVPFLDCQEIKMWCVTAKLAIEQKFCG